QYPNQVSRAVPAVCAVGARRALRRLLRRRGAGSLHAAGVSGPAGEARRGSGDHARRRIWTVADRQPPAESPLLESDQGVRAPEWGADGAEHVVQRERADRAATARSARLLPADAHGRARHGPARAGADAMSDRRILVTGGAGFLGRYVVAEIER